MVKKRRKISKKSKRISKKNKEKRLVRSTKRKIKISLTNLILFAVLTLISYFLSIFLNNEILKNLFYLLVIIFGFLGVAFLIIFLAFLFLKLMKK